MTRLLALIQALLWIIIHGCSPEVQLTF